MLPSKVLQNASSDGTITATFQNGQSISKTVHIGTPTNLGFIPIYGTYSWVPRGHASNHGVSFPPNANATAYRWELGLDNDDPSRL